MHRWAHLDFIREIVQSSTDDELRACCDSSQAEALSLPVVAAARGLLGIDSLNELLCSALSRHVPWWHEDWLASGERLESWLLNFDV